MTSLSPPVQSVLELFQGPLSSVRFADIDATGLASLAAEVEAAAGEVQQHEEKLAELKQSLAQRQEALLVLAHQALAYARIYAENDEPLLEELNRIALPRAAKPRKPSAGKAAGARDGAKPEPSTLDGTLAEHEPSAETREPDEDVATAKAGEASPARSGRKGRGASAQRTTN